MYRAARRRRPVALAVQHERWHANRRQGVPGVDLHVHLPNGGHGTQAGARQDPPPPPPPHAVVTGDTRGFVHQPLVQPLPGRSPRRHLADDLAPSLPRVRPGVVLRLHEGDAASVSDGSGRSLGVRRGEQEGHRPALRDAHDCGPFRPSGVHHGANVIHPSLEVGDARVAIGKARSALVEQDQP
jgi:hypothetical protein